MKPANRILLLALVTLALGAPLAAQRDPLSGVEIDQLREVAQDPEKRLKLFLKFTSARLDTVEAMFGDAKAKARGQRVHDALQDFRELVDELDDNIDDFSEKQADMRKVLAEVIGAEEGFARRLNAIQERTADAKYLDEAKAYSFVLQDAAEAVKLSLDDAKKTLEDEKKALGKK